MADGMIPVTRAELRAEAERLTKELDKLKDYIHRVHGTIDTILHAVDLKESAEAWLPVLQYEAKIHMGLITLCKLCIHPLNSKEHEICAKIEGPIKCQACGRHKSNGGQCMECPF